MKKKVMTLTEIRSLIVQEDAGNGFTLKATYSEIANIVKKA